MSESKKICFLSVYTVGQMYGGPEEGGWYYGQYLLEAAVPFLATVETTEYEISDEDLYGSRIPEDFIKTYSTHLAIMQNNILKWDDEQAVNNEKERLLKLFSGNGYVLFKEADLGYMEKLRKPKYC